jgi:hypothetical protein
MQISGLPETSWQVSSPCPFLPGAPGVDHLSLFPHSVHIQVCRYHGHRDNPRSLGTNMPALVSW